MTKSAFPVYDKKQVPKNEYVKKLKKKTNIEKLVRRHLAIGLFSFLKDLKFKCKLLSIQFVWFN